MAILNVAIGVPGAGKSTYMKKLDAVYVSSDAIRKELFGTEESQDEPGKVFGILNSRIRKALASGKNATYDATNVGKSSRKKILKDYKDKATEIVAYYFDIPFEEAVKRNNSRERVVPVEVIERMYNNLTPPTLDEGFDRIVHIKTVVNGDKTETIITESP